MYEEEIDEAAFKCLKYDMIKEIIPRIGKRAKFLQRYEEYKENLTERPAFAELQLDDKDRFPPASPQKPSRIDWGRIEKVCGPVPIYLKNLLKMCGYEAESSLRNLNDDDFIDMERFAREELIHLVPATQFYFHIFCSDPAREFRLVPGHRKLLLQISAYLNYTKVASEIQRPEPALRIPAELTIQREREHRLLLAQQQQQQQQQKEHHHQQQQQKAEQHKEHQQQQQLLQQQQQLLQEVVRMHQQPMSDMQEQMLTELKISHKNSPLAFEQATVFPPLSDEERIKKIQGCIVKLIDMWSEKQPIKLQIAEEMINVTYESNGYNAFIKCPMCAVQIKVSKLPTKKGDRFVISNFSKHIIKMHFSQLSEGAGGGGGGGGVGGGGIGGGGHGGSVGSERHLSMDNVSSYYGGENSDSNTYPYDDYGSGKRAKLEEDEDELDPLPPHLLHPYVSIKDEIIDLDA
ncbi:hybrid signal transduction histidine kinase B-like isoform X2 [Anopheles stephensi]|uniref:hybrid signal transduction histidine kinase B-like isoform X2 n=1 Tax=Anopheles stephensi TaxID=30069 RepID=UPI001658B531|nr:hybrid signal transduction histidine kinase B-like isoform X2 [Anopheles stephensi]XP_035906655.1 hybrid signal transduction histidine kinase B-like isoform X2 [Anopheles stephensi]